MVIGILYVVVQRDEYRSTVYIRQKNRLRIVVNCILQSMLFAIIISILSIVINIVIASEYATFNMTWTLKNSAPHILCGSPLESEPGIWSVIAYYALDMMISAMYTFMIIMLVWWGMSKPFAGYVITVIGVLLSAMKNDTWCRFILYARIDMSPTDVYMNGLQWWLLASGVIDILVLIGAGCLIVTRKDFIKLY